MEDMLNARKPDKGDPARGPHRAMRTGGGEGLILAALIVAVLALFPVSSSADLIRDLFGTAKMTKEDVDRYEEQVQEQLNQTTQVKINMQRIKAAVKASKTIRDGEREALLEKLDELEGQVRASMDDLVDLKEFMGSAGTALDLAAKMHDLEKANRSHGGAGPLSQQLIILAEGLEEIGDKLPTGLKEVITNYGKTTKAMVQATGRVEKRIRENIDQETIGLGAHSQIFSEKRKKAAAIVGSKETLVPLIPDLLYETAEHSQGLIWDRDAEEWYKIPDPNFAKDVFYEALKGTKRLKAKQLEYLATRPDTVRDMRKRAEALAKALYLVIVERQREKLSDEAYQAIFVKRLDPDVYHIIRRAGIDVVNHNLGKVFIAKCMYATDDIGKETGKNTRFSNLAASGLEQVHKALLSEVRNALKQEKGRPGKHTLVMHDIALRMPYWAAIAGIELKRIMTLTVRVEAAQPLPRGEELVADVSLSYKGKSRFRLRTEKQTATFYALPRVAFEIQAAAEGIGENRESFTPRGSGSHFKERILLGKVEGNVVLKVIEHQYHKPVDGAQVQIQGPGGYSGISRNGEVVFKNVVPGKYRLTAKAEGYAEYTEDITVAPLGGYQGRIKLGWLVYEGTGKIIYRSRRWKHQKNFSVAEQEGHLHITLKHTGEVFGILKSRYYVTQGLAGGKAVKVSVMESKNLNDRDSIRGRHSKGQFSGYIDVPRDRFSGTYSPESLSFTARFDHKNSSEEWSHEYIFKNIPRKK